MGQQLGMNQAMAPLQYQGAQQGLAQGQQQLQTGQLNLDMLKRMMDFRTQAMNSREQMISGTQSTQTGQQPGAPTGGIQNGPQGSVAASDPNDPLGSYIQRTAAANAIYNSNMAFATGQDPNKPLKEGEDLRAAARTDQLARNKITNEPKVNMMDSIFNSADPARTVMANPDMRSNWPIMAVHMGFAKDVNDPAVMQSFTAPNVRAALAYGANALRSTYGEPAKDYPVPLQQLDGSYGQRLQVERVTGKQTEVTPQKLPTYTPEISFNPATGQKSATMLQTGPGGAPAPLSPGRSPLGSRSPNTATNQPVGLGQVASTPVDVGYAPPSADNLKAAGFAQYARSAIPALGQMEATGYRMSPTNRAAVVDAATNDDPNKLMQWFSQETLANKLSGQDQQYLANLMPLLQAAGHSMSGMRLTAAAMRQGFESLIPVDSSDAKYIATVGSNRQNIYRNLLGQGGSAVRLPEFNDTLGRDRTVLSFQKRMLRAGISIRTPKAMPPM